jgi:hypothetical protein
MSIELKIEKLKTWIIEVQLNKLNAARLKSYFYFFFYKFFSYKAPLKYSKRLK